MSYSQYQSCGAAEKATGSTAEAHRDGGSGEQGGDEERADADAAEFPQVAHLDHRQRERRDDQRQDHHEDQPQEKVADHVGDGPLPRRSRGPRPPAAARRWPGARGSGPGRCPAGWPTRRGRAGPPAAPHRRRGRGRANPILRRRRPVSISPRHRAPTPSCGRSSEPGADAAERTAAATDRESRPRGVGRGRDTLPAAAPHPQQLATRLSQVEDVDAAGRGQVEPAAVRAVEELNPRVGGRHGEADLLSRVGGKVVRYQERSAKCQLKPRSQG